MPIEKKKSIKKEPFANITSPRKQQTKYDRFYLNYFNELLVLF